MNTRTAPDTTDPEEPWIRAKYGIEVHRPIGRKWTITVEKYRIRRQWALCLMHPDTRGLHEVLAYFRSEEQADKFAEFLKVLVHDDD